MASLLDRLEADYPDIPFIVRLKAALLYAGVRFDPCLLDASEWAFPNFMPYQLPADHPPHKGERRVALPYLFRLADDTQARLRIKDDSDFIVRADPDALGFAVWDGGRRITPTSFERRQPWAGMLTADGTPMRATGLSQHGDMLVLNVAPGCEYFVVPGEGRTQNLSCTFCLYGVPDKQRMEPLGQELYVVDVPRPTIDRVIEACAHPTTEAKTLYLVGGSMLDMADEGERFVRIAERLAEAGLTERYYVACGTGAIPRKHMEQMRDLGVRGACFNLEVWDPTQFERICPGKASIVGRDRWIAALEEAVDVFGPENVMSAFVGGAELDGDGAMTDPEQAVESAIEAGEYLTPRGIMATYSLFWKMTGKHRGYEPVYTLDVFLRLNRALARIRQREGRPINTAFFSKRSAYMQLEPDYDAALAATQSPSAPAPTPQKEALT